MPDYIYILKNESIPGLLKIGFTSRTPEERCSELSSATGVAAPFKVIHFREVSDGRTAEADVHRMLSTFRTNEGREFFRVASDKAIAAVDYCASDYAVGASDSQKSTSSRHQLNSEVKNLVKNRQLIAAIKLHRELTGLGLKEAKEDIDRYVCEQKGVPYTTPTGEGCLALVMILLIPSVLLLAKSL